MPKAPEEAHRPEAAGPNNADTKKPEEPKAQYPLT